MMTYSCSQPPHFPRMKQTIDVGADPFGGLVASARHVYVVRATSVEVYDAATGASVGTLGSDSYGR